MFNHLLQWFIQKRLFPDDKEAQESQSPINDDDWMVTDLRKIIFYLTISILDKQLKIAENSRTLVRNCVVKFGSAKVKEFMEIQLMHQNELSLKLLDWFDNEFEYKKALTGVPYEKEEEKVKIQMPKVPLDQLNRKPSESDLGRKGSQVGSTATTPRGSILQASQSYKERREQFKSDNKKVENTKDQYKDLINRIESNL